MAIAINSWFFFLNSKEILVNYYVCVTNVVWRTHHGKLIVVLMGGIFQDWFWFVWIAKNYGIVQFFRINLISKGLWLRCFNFLRKKSNFRLIFIDFSATLEKFAKNLSRTWTCTWTASENYLIEYTMISSSISVKFWDI